MNILKNFEKKNYHSNPFPFFTISNAFSEKEYSMLESDYKLIINQLKVNKNYSDNNVRLQISSKDFLNSEILKSTSWYDFIIFHNSKEFIFEGAEILKRDKLLTAEYLTELMETKYKSVLSLKFKQ